MDDSVDEVNLVERVRELAPFIGVALGLLIGWIYKWMKKVEKLK